MSFVDQVGWDWIQSDFGLKPVHYRGFPNSIDRWGHPSEDNGTTFNKIIGSPTGDHVIIESAKEGSINVFSFGRTCESNVWTSYLKGTEHKAMCGFINSKDMTHEQIAHKIRTIIKDPFKPSKY
jgi:hypothetical protein